MKFLFLILITVFTVKAIGQTKYTTVSENFISYHQNIAVAERMFKNDSLLQAYAWFDIAIQSYKGAINPGHYFRAALCAIKIKEEFKALDYLEKAILNGYEVDSSRKDQVVFFNQNTRNEYLKNIEVWDKKRFEAMNSEWESEFYNIQEANKKYAAVKYTSAVDFCAACLQNKACNKTGAEYVSKYRLVKEKMKADSITASNLLKSIQKNGFPTMKLVGKTASAIARSIFLNYDLDKKNERLNDLLFKALNDGHISPEFYATLIDRRNLMNGLTPEFYQPIVGYEKTIGKDITAANLKRKTIGLYTIKIVSTAATKTKDPNPCKKCYVGLYDY
jgi:hypothetical protein